MKRTMRAVLVCLIVIGTFAATAVLSGCGNGNGSSSNHGGGSGGSISVLLTSNSQTPSSPKIEQGQQSSIQLTATVTGDTSGVTWSTPTCSASNCGTLTNTSATAATYNPPDTSTTLTTNPTPVTVTAKSAKDSTKTASITINLIPAPAIPSAVNTTPAQVGQPYNVSLVTGGTPPFTLKVSPATGSITGVHGAIRKATSRTSNDCSTLPDWLTFNSQTGMLSGTGTGGMVPATATNFACSLQVTDNSGVASPAVSITINVPITILAATLPGGEQTVAYVKTTLTAVGGSGSYTGWNVSTGSLPAGLTLGADGSISGSISASASTGAQNFAVQVADAINTAVTAPQSFSINVTASPSIPSGAATSTANINSAYSLGVVSGGTAPFTLQVLPAGGSVRNVQAKVRSASPRPMISGCSALPDWLTFNGQAGTLTASTVPTSATDFGCNVQITDSLGATSAISPIAINVPVFVPAATLPAAEQSGSYNSSLVAYGGTGSYSAWSVASGSLPGGLSIDNTGKISGTVTGSTSGTFTVQVTDSVGANGLSPSYTISIAAQVAIAPPAQSSLAANIGSNYSLTLQTATNTGVGPFTWSVSSGTLPPWLNLSSAGVLSSSGAVPSTATTPPSFTVQVKDANNITATAQIGLAVPIVISGTVQNAEQSTAYSATLTAQGGSGTYSSWSIASGNLPAGLGIDNTGKISGTITGSGSSTFTVQVKDSNNAVGTSSSYTVSIVSQVAITAPVQGSQTATIGGAFSLPLQITANTGVGPFTWSVSSGTLPAWLSLNTGTGAISSTGNVPPTATDASFTVQVKDANNVVASVPLSITVPIVISGTVQNAEQSTAYSATLTAQGGSGSYPTWSIATGNLPTGLTIDNTGKISGTITGSSSGTFTVQAKDSVGAIGTSQSYTITIVPAVQIAQPVASNLIATIGGPFSLTLQTVANTGATPFTWSISTGTLPAWLGFSNGVFSVTSTVPTSANDVNVTVKVVDANNVSATLPLSITVPLSIVTTAISSGEVGVSYTSNFAAQGGMPPYTWSATGLPAWASINPATGAITNTSATQATAQGGVPVTVKVTDGATPGVSATTGQLNLVIYPVVTVTSASLPDATIGTAYTQTLSASNGVPPYSNWQLSGAPSWLTINPSTGVISGNPACPAGSLNFSAKVTDSLNVISAALPLSIVSSTPPLVITQPTVPTAMEGAAFSLPLQTTGGANVCPAPTITWSVASGSLPGWLTLNPSTGTLSGTPGVGDAGDPITFSVQASDGTNTSDPVSLTISFAGGGHNISGQVVLLGGTTGLQGVTVSADSTHTATTDTNGNFTIHGVSDGTYKLGLSYSGASSVGFYGTTSLGPNFAVTVSGANVTGVNFTAATGYTVSGKIAYAGHKNFLAGVPQVFVALQSTTCSTCQYGTAIPTPVKLGGTNQVTFHIHGVPPGTYTLSAWIDAYNFGNFNASDIVGTASSPVQVSNADVSNTLVTVNDQLNWGALDLPTLAYSSTNQANPDMDLQVTPMDSGAIVTFRPIIIDGVEQPAGYNLNWVVPSDPSTDLSACLGIAADNPDTQRLPDGGLWLDQLGISSNPVPAGTRYMIVLDGLNPYVNVPGVNSSAAAGYYGFGFDTANNSKVMFCVSAYYYNPYSTNTVTGGTGAFITTGISADIYKTVTIGAPSGGSTISGNVTLPAQDQAGNPIVPSGPLYAGCFDHNTGQIYADNDIGIPAPSSDTPYTVPYSVSGIPATDTVNGVKVPPQCSLFAFIDQTDDALLTPQNPYVYQVSLGGAGNAGIAGDIYNIDWDTSPISVSSSLSNQNIDLTPDVENSTASVVTMHTKDSGGLDKYYLNVQTRSLEQLPISVELQSGPNAIAPADFAVCSTSLLMSSPVAYYAVCPNYGNQNLFNAFLDTKGVVPQVGDSYTVQVSYATTPNTMPADLYTVSVGGLGVVNDFASGLTVSSSDGKNETPTFKWNYPSNASNYTYQFVLLDPNGNLVWRIPGNGAYGFSSGQVNATTGIVFGTDPTSTFNSPLPPPPYNQTPVLQPGQYTWYVNTMDSVGNYSQTQGTFTVQ